MHQVKVCGALRATERNDIVTTDTTHYTERTYSATREFALELDAVTLRINTGFGARSERRFEYKTLDPDYARISYRPPEFWLFLFVAVAAGAASAVLGLAGYAYQNVWPILGALVSMVLAISSLAPAVKRRKRYDSVRFLRTSGVAGLNVIRCGPETAKFEPFVDALVQRIRGVQS